MGKKVFGLKDEGKEEWIQREKYDKICDFWWAEPTLSYLARRKPKESLPYLPLLLPSAKSRD